MSLSRLRFIVFISTLYLWGAPAFAQPPAQVVGRVVAEETGQPVPDARVGLEGTPHTAVAGADGGFAFSRVAPRGATRSWSSATASRQCAPGSRSRPVRATRSTSGCPSR